MTWRVAWHRIQDCAGVLAGKIGSRTYRFETSWRQPMLQFVVCLYGDPRQLVGQVESSVTLRATVRVRIKARFAGNGRSLGKKRN